MTDNERLPEPRVEENPPDDRANAPAWITFCLAGTILLVAGIGFVAVYGVPGGGSPNQQQAAAPLPAAAPAAAPGNTSRPETPGSSTPAAPKP